MRTRLKIISLAGVGVVALALSLPVMGQDSPESLLPPGFGDPAPAPTPAPTPPPTPSAPTPSPGPTPAPVASNPSPAPAASDGAQNSGSRSNDALGSILSTLDLDSEDDLGAIDDAFQPRYYLPSGQRRSMKKIGILTKETGGIAADGFGAEGGQYLTRLIRTMNGPIISRWGSILLRRVLLSEVDSPANINPADWAAERAWRLLRIGEADAARALILKVDGGNFTPRLYEVAMQAHLATADPAGICPFVQGGIKASKAPTWVMFQPICASFSGEQGLATSQLRKARRKKTATGIDYLLAEKAIGAGFKGRRAVTIKWEEVENFNNWRYGLGMAMGIEPPNRLFAKVGRHVQGWRARAPMASRNSRLKAADTAAAIGVFSNRAMVDLYSAAYDDPDVSDDWKEQASTLRRAYVADSATKRIGAMQSLWSKSNGALTSYSAKVLTARAAAKIPASKEFNKESSNIISSMLSAGLDRNAARWFNFVSPGSPS